MEIQDLDSMVDVDILNNENTIPFDIHQLIHDYESGTIFNGFFLKRKIPLLRKLQSSTTDEDGYHHVWIKSDPKQRGVLISTTSSFDEGTKIGKGIPLDRLKRYTPKSYRKDLLVKIGFD